MTIMTPNSPLNMPIPAPTGSPVSEKDGATFRIEELEPESAPRYRGMTFPAYRHLLALQPAAAHPQEVDAPRLEPLGFGATAMGSAAGLALGGVSPDDGAARLLSVYVEPAWRRRGLGDALIARFEEAVDARGCRWLETVYTSGRPGVAIVERLLERRGWSPPEPRMHVVHFSLEQARSTPWYRKYRQRRHFELFPWAELSAEEERALRASQREHGWIAPDLVPWKYDRRPFEPISSLGVRLGGEIVGWIINHPISRDTVRLTCAFLRRDLARLGRMVPVTSESIRRLCEQTAFRNGTLTTPLNHREMAAFVRRWVEPWASFVGESRRSVKVLS